MKIDHITFFPYPEVVPILFILSRNQIRNDLNVYWFYMRLLQEGAEKTSLLKVTYWNWSQSNKVRQAIARNQWADTYSCVDRILAPGVQSWNGWLTWTGKDKWNCENPGQNWDWQIRLFWTSYFSMFIDCL